MLAYFFFILNFLALSSVCLYEETEHGGHTVGSVEAQARPAALDKRSDSSCLPSISTAEEKNCELTRPPEEVSNCHCSECCLQNEVTVVLSLQTPLYYALNNPMVVTHRLTTCPKSKCLLIFRELCLTAVSFKIDPMPSLTF